MKSSDIKAGVEYLNHEPKVKLAVDSIHGKGRDTEVVYVNTGEKDCGKYGICSLTDFAKAATSKVVEKKGKKTA